MDILMEIRKGIPPVRIRCVRCYTAALSIVPTWLPLFFFSVRTRVRQVKQCRRERWIVLFA